ncbi:timeless putative [Echinococcus multilocularis]|uniref:TIMELESS-interacting protein n=1 Tax=Echinococcus multilocularis TaxID=6211 RepID=A0A068Y732_ECHMU|nr:timeless putative [Echinococcus multilocularis]
MEGSEGSSSGSFILPSNPIMSSTQVGERSFGGSRPRSRLRPLDSDDDEDGGNVWDADAVPFPVLTHPSVSPFGSHLSEEDEEQGVGVDDGIDMVSVHSADEEDNNETGAQDLDIKTLRQLKGISAGARKKTVQRPLPKLDPPTLLGERGLPALLKDFQNVRFKGRGHEFEDLDKLMFIYESWAHRMLPKFSFMDVIERLEAVGSKREVQTALKSMRAGTWPPTITSEFIHDSSDSNSENEAPMPSANPPENEEMQDLLRLPEDGPKSPFSLPRHPLVPSTSTAVMVREHEEEEASVTARIERNRQMALQRLEAKRRAFILQTSTSYRGGPSVLRKALLPVNSSYNAQ